MPCPADAQLQSVMHTQRSSAVSQARPGMVHCLAAACARPGNMLGNVGAVRVCLVYVDMWSWRSPQPVKGRHTQVSRPLTFGIGKRWPSGSGDSWKSGWYTTGCVCARAAADCGAETVARRRWRRDPASARRMTRALQGTL